MAHKGKRRTASDRRRITGITAAAAELGVCREHLWMVLTGRRESRSLSARYRALKARA